MYENMIVIDRQARESLQIVEESGPVPRIQGMARVVDELVSLLRGQGLMMTSLVIAG